MQPIVLFIILLYLVGVTYLGARWHRSAATDEGWATAGSGMGLLLLAAGIAGTRIGGVGTYGVAGDVMTSGLWNLWYAVNTFLALALVGWVYAVPFRRLGIATVSEIFIRRFGSRRSQVLTSLCVQTEYLIVNILEPFVIGTIITAVTGWPFFVTVYIGAFVLICFTTLGGLWGSAATNIVHCTVIIFGLLLVGILGTSELGGFAAVAESIDGHLAAANQSSVAWWSFVGAGWAAVIAMFFSATIHTPAASVYVNFSAAAKRERLLLPAFLIAGGVAALMPLLSGWVGALSLAKYGPESGLRSYLTLSQLPLEISPLLGAVALAAILAAVISSGGPILLASSTMFVNDWVPNRLVKNRLGWYRTTTIVYGLIAATFAWMLEISSVLDLLLLGFAMVVPPAIGITYVLFWRRCTERAAYWGMLSGYVVGAIWFLAQKRIESLVEQGRDVTSVFWLPEGISSTLVQNVALDPSYVTTLVPVVVTPLLVWLAPGRTAAADELEDGFYRKLRQSDTQ